MTQAEFHEMQMQERLLDEALSKIEVGEHLNDDELSIVFWACGKSRKQRVNYQNNLKAIFNDWSDVYSVIY